MADLLDLDSRTLLDNSETDAPLMVENSAVEPDAPPPPALLQWPGPGIPGGYAPMTAVAGDVLVRESAGPADVAEIRGWSGQAEFADAAISTNAGVVTSQGVAAMKADDFATTFRVDGRGITVGVISDSFDTDKGTGADGYAPPTTAADDIASGDLPAEGVNVLLDLADSASGTIDEGRAMAQIVHDIAPGASIAFHTGFPSAADMVTAVNALAEISDVIVDDLGFLFQPVYMDGAIAQAVNDAFDSGVAYFSSAGNSADRAHESEYRGVAASDAAVAAQLGPLTFGGNPASLASQYLTFHDFNPDPDVIDLRMSVTLQPDRELPPISSIPMSLPRQA